MGVTMASEAVFEAFVGDDPCLTLWHGHSFTANPLGCAAANASLDLLERNPLPFNSSNNGIVLIWNGWRAIGRCNIPG